MVRLFLPRGGLCGRHRCQSRLLRAMQTQTRMVGVPGVVFEALNKDSTDLHAS